LLLATLQQRLTQNLAPNEKGKMKPGVTGQQQQQQLLKEDCDLEKSTELARGEGVVFSESGILYSGVLKVQIVS
jgi:hypothetical protein